MQRVGATDTRGGDVGEGCGGVYGGVACGGVDGGYGGGCRAGQRVRFLWGERGLVGRMDRQCLKGEPGRVLPPFTVPPPSSWSLVVGSPTHRSRPHPRSAHCQRETSGAAAAGGDGWGDGAQRRRFGRTTDASS